jgi:hypothetical protein
MEAAFATGRERVEATVDTWNAPSFRVLEKNGFHAHHNGYGERVSSSGWFGTQQSDEFQTAPVHWDGGYSATSGLGVIPNHTVKVGNSCE